MTSTPIVKKIYPKKTLKTLGKDGDDYVKNSITHTEALKPEQIQDKLKDYVLLTKEEYSTLKMGDHIRYFIEDKTDPNTRLFRIGGSIINISGLPIWILLANATAKWSVTLEKAIIYRKKTNKEIETKYNNDEIEKIKILKKIQDKVYKKLIARTPLDQTQIENIKKKYPQLTKTEYIDHNKLVKKDEFYLVSTRLDLIREGYFVKGEYYHEQIIKIIIQENNNIEDVPINPLEYYVFKKINKTNTLENVLDRLK
jgi:hypothetical protein